MKQSRVLQLQVLEQLHSKNNELVFAFDKIDTTRWSEERDMYPDILQLAIQPQATQRSRVRPGCAIQRRTWMRGGTRAERAEIVHLKATVMCAWTPWRRVKVVGGARGGGVVRGVGEGVYE
jgi:hypothetical protein